jgi:hypothetical protein
MKTSSTILARYGREYDTVPGMVWIKPRYDQMMWVEYDSPFPHVPEPSYEYLRILLSKENAAPVSGKSNVS